jgi:hypothetical protein
MSASRPSLSRRWLIAFIAALPLASRALAQEQGVPLPDGAPETVEPAALAKKNVATLKP